jgi:N-acylglucosamine-6-phosphate 2-epimerase
MGILRTLQKGLIVSCQAKPGSPLRNPQVMAAMAQAAEAGGAVGIRANGAQDIAAIYNSVKLPIIGINKVVHDGFDVLITPTLDAARQVVAAGADIIAMDATLRPRPDGLSVAQAIQLYKRELGVPIMADISTLEEGLAAAEAGANIVATTLSGYTPYSRQQEDPDFLLIAELSACLQTPIIAEGRLISPEDARRALELGAHAVVIGTSITAVDWITQRYVAALQDYLPDENQPQRQS